MTTSTSWTDRFTDEELRSLTTLHDWRSWLTIAVDWGLVLAACGLVHHVPHPLTILLALAVIGGRQLGLAVVMHEASHRTLFRNVKLNDWAGNWLAAYPVWADLRPYRRYHLQHHAHTWTERDPDLGLATPFPISRASLARKIWRDLSGQTGWKRVKAILRRDLVGHLGKTFRGDEAGWKTLIPVAVSNGVLLGVLIALGWGWTYLLWPAAWMTTYSLIMRIRSIAEHSMPQDPGDELMNSRTTEASWLERLLVAPNGVCFHLEHHLHMGVPHYHLLRMHRMLKERGVLDGVRATNGYLELLRRASARPA